MSFAVLAQRGAIPRSKVWMPVRLAAAVITLRERWGGLLALMAPGPPDLHDVEHIDRGLRFPMSDENGSEHGLHECCEVPTSGRVHVVWRLLLADVAVVKGEAPKVRGVSESTEDYLSLVAMEALRADVDVAEVLAHAADAVDEDFELTEAVEVEVVATVQDRCRFVEDLLARTQYCGE